MGRSVRPAQGHTPLLEKATLHVPFSSLAADEREQLLEYAPSSSRRGLMGRLATMLPIASSAGPRPRSARRTRPPTTDRFRSTISLAGGPKPGEEPTDAREAAKELGYHPDKWEAAIVVGKRGDYMLLDGYTRAVAYMRAAPSSAKLAVWVPDE